MATVAYGYFDLVRSPPFPLDFSFLYRILDPLRLALAQRTDSRLTSREHENQWPVNNHYADDFISECETYDVNTKKRIALLPETLRWFHEDGELIEAIVNSDDEDEEIDDEQPGVDGEHWEEGVGCFCVDGLAP